MALICPIKPKGDALINVEITVQEVAELFKQIQKREKFFEIIRLNVQSTIFITPFLAEKMSDEKALQRSLESVYGSSPVKPFGESTHLSSA